MMMMFALALAATAQAVPGAQLAPPALADHSNQTQHQQHADHQKHAYHQKHLKHLKQCHDMMATMHKGMNHDGHAKHGDASPKTRHMSH